jgi:hypothetical protein
LRNAQLAASFLAQPVRVPAAEAVFADNRVEWTAASIAYGPVRGDLALSYPLACASPTGCVPRFTLRMATLDAATAQNALLGARSHGEIVQELLDRIRSLNQSGPSWPTLAGDVQIGTLTVGDLALRDVVADVSIAGRSIELKSASARALDGQLRLSGAMRIEGDSPRYQLQAQLDRASAAATAALFQEKWGPGSINLRTSLTFSGFEQQELLASATGTFSWEWSKGALPLADFATKGSNFAPVSPAAFAGLGRFDLWTAEGSIANRVLTLRKSQVVAGSRATPLAGTVSFTRELNLIGDQAKTGSAAPAVKIGGTLARPH